MANNIADIVQSNISGVSSYNPCIEYCNVQMMDGYNAGLVYAASKISLMVEIIFASMMVSFICKVLLAMVFSERKCRIADQTGNIDLFTRKEKIRKLLLNIDNSVFYLVFTMCIYLFLYGVLGYTGISIK